MVLGSIFSGTIITEQVFSYPGSRLAPRHGGQWRRHRRSAWPSPAFSIVAVAAAIFIVDLLQPLIDPRVQGGVAHVLHFPRSAASQFRVRVGLILVAIIVALRDAELRLAHRSHAHLPCAARSATEPAVLVRHQFARPGAVLATQLCLSQHARLRPHRRRAFADHRARRRPRRQATWAVGWTGR